MKNRYIATLLLAGLFAAPMAAQMPEGFLDIFVAKVKMGKRVEFDAISKREVEINRKHKGDNWVAYEVLYGEPNTVYFTATRTGFGGVEQGLKAFEGALSKALGVPGMHKLFADLDATVDSEHNELRRRRWDLTASVPANPEALNQMLGQARFLRTVTVRVRPGRILDYEAQLKMSKAAQERVNPGIPSLVSQGIAGQPTGVFYITNLVKSLGDFDRIKTLQEVLGSSYASYQKVVADAVLSTDIVISRILPELSSAPDEVVAVDTKFWRPAPPPPPPAKTADDKK